MIRKIFLWAMLAFACASSPAVADSGALQAKGLAIKAQAAAQAAKAPRVRIVSPSGGFLNYSVRLSNGTATSGTDRIGFTMNTKATALQFLFVNGFASSSGQLNHTGNPITIAAGLEAAPQILPISIGQGSANPISSASFTASTSGALLTVSALSSGTIVPGMTLYGVGIGTNAANITIASNGTGTGGIGTYNLSASAGTIASEAMTANGVGAYTLASGQMSLSAPLNGGIFQADSTYYYRVHKTVTSGQRWPVNIWTGQYAIPNSTTNDPVYGSTVTNGNDAVSSYQSATGAFALGAYAYGATAIIGQQLQPKYVVLGSGDSVLEGFADGSSQANGRGYVVRALVAAGIGYHNNGNAGTTLTNITGYGQVQQALAAYADAVVMHAGTNDCYTGLWPNLAAAQTAYLASAQAFSNVAGKRLFYGTILPRNTSTGNTWADYASQSVITTLTSGSVTYEALRVQINNWLRDPTSTGFAAQANALLAPNNVVVAVYDETPGVERNSDGSAVVLSATGQQTAGTGGYWITNGTAAFYTADGIHPTANATVLLAPYVPVSKMALSAQSAALPANDNGALSRQMAG